MNRKKSVNFKQTALIQIIYIYICFLIQIENRAAENCTEIITLNDNPLQQKEAVQIPENSEIRIGNQQFTVRHIETPSVIQLKDLLDSLQCGVCSKLLDKARSLSCQHVFCERCLNDIVKSSTTISQKRQQTPANNDAPLSPVARFSCPSCRKSLPVNEAYDARPQKALTEISRLMQDMIETRPTCAMCANQRWLALGSDYKNCETCYQILCPLCALDFHRDHDLKSNFSDMLRTSREFSQRTAPIKREWSDILKQVEEAKEMARKAGAWIEMMKSHIRKNEAAMSGIMTPAVTAFKNVQNLQIARFDSLVDGQRAEAVKNLENAVLVLQQKMPPIAANMDGQLKLLTEIVKELEKIPDENGEMISFEPTKRVLN